ncbi:BGTF surface domain-containing protein [Halobaculum sp. D14]|uniref:DUF7827 domain-containing protein n=1 Tax=Halobaculum sp. D14 TaxID=3421642 RepID=UPI003EBE44E6
MSNENLDTANSEFTFDLNSTNTNGVTANVTVTLTLDTTGASTNQGTSLTISATDAGTDAQFQFDVVDPTGGDDTNFDPNGLVYKGQELKWDYIAQDNDNTGSGKYYLYKGGETPTQLRPLVKNQTAGYVTVSTANLADDTQYFISNDGASSPDVNFTVTTQDLTAEFAEDTVGNAAPGTVDLEVTSNQRPGAYDMYVTSAGLEDDELFSVFARNNASQPGTYTVKDVDVDDDGDVADDDGILIGTDKVATTKTFTANFTDIDAGTYNFTFDVTDTTAEDNASITVENVGEGTSGFVSNTVTANQGDVAKFNVSVSGASDYASVSIGDYTSIGYEANFTVYDENNDGRVTVYFNTYAAGNPNATDQETVYLASDSDDSITNISQHPSNGLTEVLATGNYELATAAGQQVYSTLDESPDDVGTLVLNQRSTTSAQIWTAPGSLSDLDTKDDGSSVTASDITTHVENNVVTQDNQIANGDYVIVQVSASGLGGMSEVFGAHFYNSSDVGGQLTVNQSGSTGNFAPKVIDIANSSISVVADRDTDNYYFVIDTGSADFDRTTGEASVSPSDGETYKATYTVSDDFLLKSTDSDDHQAVNGTYEAAERSLSISSDPVQVNAAMNQTISGDTSLAPGTEVTVRAQSDQGVQPAFFKSKTVKVKPDGTWSADFDFTTPDGINAGDTFGVTATANNGQSVKDTADGEVIEGTPKPTTSAGTTSTTSTTEPPTTTSTTSTTEPPQTSTTTEPPATTTTTTTPGFTAVLGIVALLGAALLAIRRD